MKVAKLMQLWVRRHTKVGTEVLNVRVGFTGGLNVTLSRSCVLLRSATQEASRDHFLQQMPSCSLRSLNLF